MITDKLCMYLRLTAGRKNSRLPIHKEISPCRYPSSGKDELVSSPRSEDGDDHPQDQGPDLEAPELPHLFHQDCIQVYPAFRRALLRIVAVCSHFGVSFMEFILKKIRQLWPEVIQSRSFIRFLFYCFVFNSLFGWTYFTSNCTPAIGRNDWPELGFG